MTAIVRRARAALALSLALAPCVLVALVGAPASAAAQDAAAAGTREDSVVVRGIARHFVLHVPPSDPDSGGAPLVIVLHGRGGSATGMEAYSGMSAVADRERFVVAYPEGLGAPSYWNVWPDPAGGGMDDVGFVRAIIDRLRRTLHIDDRRIYIAGHSNGGIMAYKLGADLGRSVAAIGVVAGSIGWRSDLGQQVVVPAPRRRVPAIIIHGLLDTIVPFRDTAQRSPLYRRAIPTEESAAFWARHSGCDTTPVREPLDAGAGTRERYACRDDMELVLYVLARGGHGWPTASGPAGMDAATTLWEFFARHRRR